MRLFAGPELIRQKCPSCSEQKRRALMGRFLAQFFRIRKGLPSDQESRGHRGTQTSN